MLRDNKKVNSSVWLDLSIPCKSIFALYVFYRWKWRVQCHRAHRWRSSDLVNFTPCCWGNIFPSAGTREHACWSTSQLLTGWCNKTLLLTVLFALFYIKHVYTLNPVQSRVCGLCGNFDGNVNNDLISSNNQLEVDASHFGNSWKVVPSCADVTQVKIFFFLLLQL